MIRILMICCLLIAGLQQISAQSIKQLSIAATTEAIGLPFTNYDPFHPGAEITATFRKNESVNNTKYLSMKAGFFHHQRLMNGIYLGGEYQYSQKLFNEKVSIDLPLGAGYLHTFYPSEIYEQNEEGVLEPISQLGRGHLYVNVGVGLTYLSEGAVQPFIRQELLVQTPFANGIPLVPHSLLKVGIQIKI